MTRGMGSQTARWLAIGGLLGMTLLGCGGATSNPTRNLSRGTVVNTTDAVTLRYAPARVVRFRRTTRMDATLDGHRFVVEVVNDETLGPMITDITRRCVRSHLTIDTEDREVPCGASHSQARQVIERFASLGALSVITYPTGPVRVGDSWDCEGATLQVCQWTLRAIEHGPTGRVAILHVRVQTAFHDRPMPVEMTYVVRIDDGVPLSAEMRGGTQGQLSFQGTWTSEALTN